MWRALRWKCGKQEVYFWEIKTTKYKHSFIPQILMEGLLCARYCAKHWEYCRGVMVLPSQHFGEGHNNHAQKKKIICCCGRLDIWWSRKMVRNSVSWKQSCGIDSRGRSSAEIARFRGFLFGQRWTSRRKKKNLSNLSARHYSKHSTCIKAMSLSPFWNWRNWSIYNGVKRVVRGECWIREVHHFLPWRKWWHELIWGVRQIYKGTPEPGWFLPWALLESTLDREVVYPDGLQQDSDQQGCGPPAVLNINNTETFVEENPKERQDFLLNCNDSETSEFTGFMQTFSHMCFQFSEVKHTSLVLQKCLCP